MAERSKPCVVSRADIVLGKEANEIDAFVRNDAVGTPFHLTGWSRAIETGCGQESHYLVARDGKGAIVGVLPLSIVRSRLFGNALVSCGFAVGGGVLSGAASVSASLIAYAERLAQSLGCSTLELRGGVSPDGDWHRDADTYLGFEADLAKDDDAQLLAVPRKQRAEIRRAMDAGLEVKVGRDETAQHIHYAVYAESVRNLGTPVFPKALFAAVLDEFGDESDILFVRKGKQPLAAVLSLYWRGTVMPYWGGGTTEARKWRANDQLYFGLMLHARKEKGCTRFDFGRSKAGTGPAAFKRNWGFEGVALSYFKKAIGEAGLRDVNPMSPKYRIQVALWQKLPVWVANRIGPIVSRGLG